MYTYEHPHIQTDSLQMAHFSLILFVFVFIYIYTNEAKMGHAHIYKSSCSKVGRLDVKKDQRIGMIK